MCFEQVLDLAHGETDTDLQDVMTPMRTVRSKTSRRKRSPMLRCPAYVSLKIEPRTADSTEPYNQLPTGRHPFISIYGSRLTLMGGLPGVGVRLRCVATDEEYFYPSSKMSVNSVNRLCFPTDIDFTPGKEVR